jgi:pSer/pThr/pTyr-binding forkhead associated (FHA) protein
MDSIWLSVIGDEETYEIDTFPTTVGRNSINGVQIEHPEVSRLHFKIGRDDNPAWGANVWIKPEDTKNSTYLNGEKLPAEERRMVHDGDVLEIGSLALKVHKHQPKGSEEALGDGEGEDKSSGLRQTEHADGMSFHELIRKLHRRYNGDLERIAQEVRISPADVGEIVDRLGLE